jgi:hypothetical protein
MISPLLDAAFLQVAKPATISLRILSDKTSLVVLRPAAWDFSVSRRLAAMIGAKAFSSAKSLAKAS